MLSDIVDRAEAALTTHRANMAAVDQSANELASIVAEFKAEATRVPTPDDIRVMLDRMEAGRIKLA